MHIYHRKSQNYVVTCICYVCKVLAIMIHDWPSWDLAWQMMLFNTFVGVWKDTDPIEQSLDFVSKMFSKKCTNLSTLWCLGWEMSKTQIKPFFFSQKENGTFARRTLLRSTLLIYIFFYEEEGWLIAIIFSPKKLPFFQQIHTQTTIMQGSRGYFIFST